MYMNKNITSLMISPYILLYPVLSCFHTINTILNLYKFWASFNILSFSFLNPLQFFKYLHYFYLNVKVGGMNLQNRSFPHSCHNELLFFMSHNLRYIYMIDEPHFKVQIPNFGCKNIPHLCHLRYICNFFIHLPNSLSIYLN